MKKIVLLFLFTTALGFSQTTDEEYDALTKKSPFNKMYPKVRHFRHVGFGETYLWP